MTLEEARKIRDLVEKIEELKNFNFFIKEYREESFSIRSNSMIYGSPHKNVPNEIAEALVTLTETIIVSLEEQLKNL